MAKQQAVADHPLLRSVSLEVESPGLPPSRRQLEPGDYVLGASPEADLILPEAGVDRLLTLRVEQIRNQTVVNLIAHNDNILDGAQPLAVGTPVKINGATTLTSGTLTLSITPPLPLPDKKDWNAPFGALALALLLAGVAWFLTGLSSTPRLPAPVVTAAPVAPPKPVVNLNLPTGVEAELRKRFVASDLGERLQVKSSSQTVTVEGTVNMREEQRMAEIIEAVRARTPISIILAVKPESGVLTGRLVGISLEPFPTLILKDGERLRIGDPLPGGWKIDAIESRRVVISRDGFRDSVEF